jgi:hypothetical protein
MLSGKGLFSGSDMHKVLKKNKICDLSHVPNELKWCSHEALDLVL